MFFLDYQLPTRPGLGTQGRQIRLRSNFYEVKNLVDEIIQYDVTISDGRTEDNFPKALNLLIIEELVKSNQNIFRRRPAYDAKKILYSVDELPFKSKVSVSNTLQMIWKKKKKKNFYTKKKKKKKKKNLYSSKKKKKTGIAQNKF